MNLLKKLNLVPPNLCRFLARKRHGTRPMTNSDIAHVAVMSRGLVAKLSKLRNWSQVNISIATRFSMACGVDLLAPSEQIRFLRKRALKYQKTGSPMQKKMFRRIANELVKPERQ